MLYTVTITTEASGTIEPVYRTIKVVVGLTQLRWHSIDIVEIGECRVWKLSAGIQNCLSECA